MIRWTTPWRTVVLPIAKVSAPIKKERYIKIILSELIPRLNGRSKIMEIAATAGMVNPMLARADPSAKFKLLCKRLAREARTAAKLSGKSTNSAMAIPTIVLGAPAALTPASMAGLSALANPTTASNAIRRSPALTNVFKLLGLGA